MKVEGTFYEGTIYDAHMAYKEAQHGTSLPHARLCPCTPWPASHACARYLWRRPLARGHARGSGLDQGSRAWLARQGERSINEIPQKLEVLQLEGGNAKHRQACINARVGRSRGSSEAVEAKVEARAAAVEARVTFAATFTGQDNSLYLHLNRSRPVAVPAVHRQTAES